MARALTTEEKNILASRVVFPDEWWEDVNTNEDMLSLTAEEALSAKIKRIRPFYEKATQDPDYKTRLQIDIDDPWKPHFVAPGITVEVPADWRPPEPPPKPE